MRLSRICAITALLLTSADAVSASEKGAALMIADLVVVGQLRLSSLFLSVDGVHVNGAITPTEVLYSNSQNAAPLAFHYVLPCFALYKQFFDRQFACSYGVLWDHWSESKALLTQPGIWTLWHSGSSWTAPIEGLHVLYSLGSPVCD